ncbi:MAG: PQQ-dependent sugar dehydrogenase [Candidatus Hodarchaeales archaeon]|jgi:glucose/arabinose dehydrogenase
MKMFIGPKVEIAIATVSVLLIIFLTGFLSSTISYPQNVETEYDITIAFPDLSFSNPVGILNAGDNRLFVVEQAGIIQIIDSTESNDSTKQFLDIKDRVLYGGEQGLLGLAFHPDFTSNGLFYVNYVADGPRRTIISQFKIMDDDYSLGNKSSEVVLLEVLQPYSNHNGGDILFGSDGYLYIAMGDGGSFGDPDNNGQDLKTLLGAILRINVDLKASGNNYAIPNDNPFVGNFEGYREEIYAYGLRNPWRMSFDFNTSSLWVGDVGQNNYEEIDIVEKGGNYGWKIQEGTHCYVSPDCNSTGLQPPVWEYDHSEGTSITGGYVYYGSLLPSLHSKYIYGDYGSGKIWALNYNDSNYENILVMDTTINIVSFGVRFDGEYYVVGYDGTIYTLEENLNSNDTSSTSSSTSTSIVDSTVDFESGYFDNSFGIAVSLFLISFAIISTKKRRDRD